MAKKKTNYGRYTEWWQNRTPEEISLHTLAFDYEESVFADLRLLTPAIRKQLCEYELQAEDGSWHKTEDDLAVTIDGWIFAFRRNPDWLGLCNSKRQTIYIRPGLTDIEHHAAVLHEMIHAYENQLSHPFREWLLLYFHAKLAKKIKPAKLNRCMNASTHMLVHNASHGLLFLLKSLELDLRFGWNLGTVFGYGREDMFSTKRKST